jgi:hypothetical protein
MRAGRPQAAARRELRKDGKARRLACRDAVLQWLDAREGEDATTEISEIVRSPLGWFCGASFTIDDVTKTIISLREKRLVTGPDNEPRITAEGIDCVERYGGVVEYLNRQDRGGVQVTIQGDNNGQLAVANRDVEQAQNQANDANVLMAFAQALREFAEVAGSEEAEYNQLADMLEAEAKKDDRDEGWVRSLLERARNLLGKADKFKSLAQLIGIGFQVYGVSHGDSA